MEISVFITSFLTSIGVVGALAAIVVYLGKNWIETRIQESVRHEYAKALEDYKASLQEDIARSADERAADKALFQEFQEVLPATGKSICFVRDESGATPFNWGELAQFDVFVEEWNNTAHEFHSVELEKKRKCLYEIVAKYMNCLAVNTFRVSATHSSIARELKAEDPSKYGELVQELNDLAQQVFDSYESFVQATKKELQI